MCGDGRLVLDGAGVNSMNWRTIPNAATNDGNADTELRAIHRGKLDKLLQYQMCSKRAHRCSPIDLACEASSGREGSGCVGQKGRQSARFR